MKRKHSRSVGLASISLTMLLGLGSITSSAQPQPHKPSVTFVAKSAIPGVSTRSRSKHRLNFSIPTTFEGEKPSTVETKIFMMTKFQVEILEVKDGDPSKIQIDCKAARNNSIIFGAGPVTNQENPEFSRLVGKTLILEELADMIAARPRNVKPGDQPFWGPMRARFTKRSRAQAWFPSASTLFEKREFQIGEVVSLQPTAVEEFFQLPARVSDCKNSTFSARLVGATTRGGVECGIFDVTISAIDARTGRPSAHKQSSSMNLECTGSMIIGVNDLFLYDVELSLKVAAWANGKDKPKTLSGDAVIKISHAQSDANRQFDSVSLTESEWHATKLVSKKDPVVVSESSSWSGAVSTFGQKGRPHLPKLGSFDVTFWVGKKRTTKNYQIENGWWKIKKREFDRVSFSNGKFDGRKATFSGASFFNADQFPDELKFQWHAQK
ncbi:MAG: hypothetical protein ACI97A_003446 [Planctomycetota bacterium]|jgi:hypothetical protein